MPSEVISLHVGQAGIQTGNAVWELLCNEHEMDPNGCLDDISDTVYDNTGVETFFHLIKKKNRYTPRAIFCDSEPTVVDEVRTGTYRTLFQKDNLISGTESSANIFARGNFDIADEMSGRIFNQIRKLIERCDTLQGFMIYRSLGGGTGSGLTCALFDQLVEYGKTPRIECPVYPSPELPTAVVEPYNCVFGQHFCMEDIDLSFLFDNQALFESYKNHLKCSTLTYTDINRLMAQITSSLTAGIRFENVLSSRIDALVTNLVPYPRIHFPLVNYSPLITPKDSENKQHTIECLTRDVFQKQNQMVTCNPLNSRYMSCCLIYRGNVNPRQINEAITVIKSLRKVNFVDWCPTGFKVGITFRPPVQVLGSRMATSDKHLTMITNSSSMGSVINHVTRRFYKLFARRSFVHWYVGEGLEESEFTDSLLNLASLVKDYEEVSLEWDTVQTQLKNNPDPDVADLVKITIKNPSEESAESVKENAKAVDTETSPEKTSDNINSTEILEASVIHVAPEATKPDNGGSVEQAT